MPIIGITLDAERDFVSKFDTARGTPEEAVFKIGTLDSRIFGMIRDRATTMDVDPTNPEATVATSVNANAVAFETVQYGLRGWRNFNDSQGQPIEFRTVKQSRGGKSYTVVDPELLRRMPQAVLMELAEEIRRENEVSGVEAKN
jgi:hypothetical protein